MKNAIRKTSDPVHVDETGWRESGKNHYAWVACTKEITLISIRESRARREFENILAPAAKQAIVTDRYSAYMKAKGPHQFCLAHIIRNCQRYAEKTGIQRIVGQGLVKELKEVFNLWIEYKNDRLDLRQFRARTNYRRGKLKEWLYDGICHPTHKKLQRFCKGLLKDFDCLWTYLRIPDMEPTNNAAERDIRHLVLKRKIGFGSKSRIGSTFIERLCSIMQTLRKKKQSLLHFLTATMRNFFSLLPPPQPLA